MWDQLTFRNIARSEQTHMDALEALIDRYELESPVEDRAVGEFANRELQELYDSLVREGSESLARALRVGATVEEIDILDLEEYIVGTDAEDLIQVYENLLRGSRNHLRAFSSVVEREEGEAYQPQYMGDEAYENVIEAAMGTGGMGRRAGDGTQPGENGVGARGSGSARGLGGRGERRSNAPSAGWGSGECQQ